MSEKEDDKSVASDEESVVEVTEDVWQEDTLENDIRDVVAGLHEGDARPNDLAGSPLPSERPTEPPSAADAEESSPAHFTQPATPWALHLQKARRAGTGIWYAGVLLWTYLIVGEYVVSAGMPEFIGWSAFSGVVVGAFLHGANRIGTRSMAQAGAISVAAVISGTLFLSMIVGSPTRSEYQLVSLLLLAVSVGLVGWGIRHSRGGLPRAVRPPGSSFNWPRAATWAVFVGNTALIAFAFLAEM